jgi:hypothetical protein
MEECERARQQGLKFVVIRIERHGGARIQVVKGLLGSVVGSDKHGSFVSLEIAKAEAKLAGMDPNTDIPKTFAHRAKVILP